MDTSRHEEREYNVDTLQSEVSPRADQQQNGVRTREMQSGKQQQAHTQEQYMPPMTSHQHPQQTRCPVQQTEQLVVKQQQSPQPQPALCDMTSPHQYQNDGLIRQPGNGTAAMQSEEQSQQSQPAHHHLHQQ